MKKIIIIVLLTFFIYLKLNSQVRFGLGMATLIKQNGTLDLNYEVDYDFKNLNLSLEARVYIFSDPLYIGSTYNVNIVDNEKINYGFNLGVYFKGMGSWSKSYPTVGVSWYHYEKPYFVKVSILDHKYPNIQLTFGIFLNTSRINFRFKKVNQLRCPR